MFVQDVIGLFISICLFNASVHGVFMASDMCYLLRYLFNSNYLLTCNLFVCAWYVCMLTPLHKQWLNKSLHIENIEALIILNYSELPEYRKFFLSSVADFAKRDSSFVAKFDSIPDCISRSYPPPPHPPPSLSLSLPPA